jgi:hypothetical protein
MVNTATAPIRYYRSLLFLFSLASATWSVQCRLITAGDNMQPQVDQTTIACMDCPRMTSSHFEPTSSASSFFSTLILSSNIIKRTSKIWTWGLSNSASTYLRRRSKRPTLLPSPCGKINQTSRELQIVDSSNSNSSNFVNASASDNNNSIFISTNSSTNSNGTDNNDNTTTDDGDDARETALTALIWIVVCVAVLIGLNVMTLGFAVWLDNIYFCCPSWRPVHEVVPTDYGPLAKRTDLAGMTIQERKQILTYIFGVQVHDLSQVDVDNKTLSTQPPEESKPIQDGKLEEEIELGTIIKPITKYTWKYSHEEMTRRQCVGSDGSHSDPKNDDLNSTTNHVEQALHQECGEVHISSPESNINPNTSSNDQNENAADSDLLNADKHLPLDLVSKVKPAETCELGNNSINNNLVDSDIMNTSEENEDLPMNDADHERLCCICLNEYVSDEILMTGTQCNHIFHRKCCLTWLQKKDHCPYCRKVMIEPKLFVEAAICVLGDKRVADLRKFNASLCEVREQNTTGTTTNERSSIHGTGPESSPVHDTTSYTQSPQSQDAVSGTTNFDTQ